MSPWGLLAFQLGRGILIQTLSLGNLINKNKEQYNFLLGIFLGFPPIVTESFRLSITKHELYTRCRVRYCRYKGDHVRVFILALPSKPISEARHTQLATHTTQTARYALIIIDSNWGQ